MKYLLFVLMVVVAAAQPAIPPSSSAKTLQGQPPCSVSITTNCVQIVDSSGVGVPASVGTGSSTGTSSETYQLDNQNSGCKLSMESGVMVMRDAAGTGYCNLSAGGITSNATESYTKLTCGTLPASPATGMVACDGDDSNRIKVYITSAWYPISYTTGTTAPATCTVGQTFFDTDATAGSNWYGCTATNTWTALGGSGSYTSATNDAWLLPFGPNTIIGADGGNAMTSANAIYYFRVFIPLTITISKVWINIGTSQSSETFYFGIYNNAGSSLLASGSMSTTSTGDVSSTLGSPVTLQPGFYVWAYGMTHTTPQCRVIGTFDNKLLVSASYNRNSAGNATETYSGSMPASLTLTGTTAEQPCIARLEHN